MAAAGVDLRRGAALEVGLAGVEDLPFEDGAVFGPQVVGVAAQAGDLGSAVVLVVPSCVGERTVRPRFMQWSMCVPRNAPS